MSSWSVEFFRVSTSRRIEFSPHRTDRNARLAMILCGAAATPRQRRGRGFPPCISYLSSQLPCNFLPIAYYSITSQRPTRETRETRETRPTVSYSAYIPLPCPFLVPSGHQTAMVDSFDYATIESFAYSLLPRLCPPLFPHFLINHHLRRLSTSSPTLSPSPLTFRKSVHANCNVILLHKLMQPT